MNAETVTAVPLNKLVASAANVRRTRKEAGMDELMASIRNKGLLQNLVVKPGKKAGTYEVVAGERRRTALSRLAKSGEIAKDFPVPVRVTEGSADTDISLSENVVRERMHDADAVLAFAELADKHGLSPEEIADRYGVSHMTVRRRLRLAAVSPKIMEQFREDKVTVAQMMALASTPDHAAQEAAWFDAAGWQRNPENIKAALTKGRIRLNSHVVTFVGLDGYKAAGGRIEADLFAEEGAGYIEDADLLNRLALEKLQESVAAVKAEGWLWVESMLACGYEEYSKYERVYPVHGKLDAEDDAALSALSEQADALAERVSQEEEESGEASPVTAGLLAEVEAKITVLQEKSERFSDASLAHGGAIVAIDRRDGTLEVHRGLVRPEDQKAHKAAKSGEAVAEDAEASEAAQDDVSVSELSKAMVEDLSKTRTFALRRALVNRPDLAKIVLVHGLTLKRFYTGTYGESVLTLATTFTNLTTSKDDPDNTVAAEEMDGLHEAWTARLPEESGDLWVWFAQASAETIDELMAYVVAENISAVQFATNRNKPADDLAAALQHDMADWWRPSPAFFQRNPKAIAVAALIEAGKPDAAKAADAAKKGDAVTIAVKALEGSRWLPQPYRLESPSNEAADEAGDE